MNTRLNRLAARFIHTPILLAGHLAALLLLANAAQAAAFGANKAASPITQAYGTDKAQTFDIYSPAAPNAAPILIMVHGGAWRIGDKDADAVVDNKIKHWLPKGFIFISVNYRLLPEADPLTQAHDVAKAIHYIEQHAKEWGGDSHKIIAMGHSAGAHLIALISASASLQRDEQLSPWLGSVILDSAAYDIPRIMNAKHYRFYDAAFGKDTGYWQQTSPIFQLQKNSLPMLLVCSSKRDDSCPQAQSFNAAMASFNIYSQVVSEPLSHRDINKTLGEASDYTQTVDDFIERQLAHR